MKYLKKARLRGNVLYQKMESKKSPQNEGKDSANPENEGGEENGGDKNKGEKEKQTIKK